MIGQGVPVELLDVARRHTAAGLVSEWYLFGSYLEHDGDFDDIDVLVVCGEGYDTRLLRADVDALRHVPAPVDLYIMSMEEVEELEFVARTGAQQFFGSLR
jgi:predicted nucleotidyltransferase